MKTVSQIVSSAFHESKLTFYDFVEMEFAFDYSHLNVSSRAKSIVISISFAIQCVLKWEMDAAYKLIISPKMLFIPTTTTMKRQQQRQIN